MENDHNRLTNDDNSEIIRELEQKVENIDKLDWEPIYQKLAKMYEIPVEILKAEFD